MSIEENIERHFLEQFPVGNPIVWDLVQQALSETGRLLDAVGSLQRELTKDHPSQPDVLDPYPQPGDSAEAARLRRVVWNIGVATAIAEHALERVRREADRA
ncbi:hypothetical protein RVV79_003329 [Burkholderia contaminans]|nr:hypothetical protein [Burkholderia contaminans]